MIVGLAVAGAAQAQETCPEAPPPVLTLDYGSRYEDDSETRSELDEAADAEVDAALAPLDDFLRDMSEVANRVHAPEQDPLVAADCVLARLEPWAEADALAQLDSQAAQLTAGSRLASLALILRQVAPHTQDAERLGTVLGWLDRRMQAQMRYWEQDAPGGARQGNLRAWAALAAAATADLTSDPVTLGWAAWSTSYVLCTANDDGSLPQEMIRGRHALHYQLHAVTPLVVSTVLLEAQGVPMRDRCDNALDRVVAYTVADLDDGAMTLERTGEVQTYFDGTRELQGFNIAWLEAYLTLNPDPTLEALAAEWRPLSHSKLGGDQTAMWGAQQ